MMNEEEKFDDLLRNKMSGRDFFFDEENWQKANELIDRDQNRKRRKRFAIILFSGIAIGVGITVPVMMSLLGTNNTKTIAAVNPEGSTTSATPSASQPSSNNEGNAKQAAPKVAASNSSVPVTSGEQNGTSPVAANNTANNAATTTESKNATNTEPSSNGNQVNAVSNSNIPVAANNKHHANHSSAAVANNSSSAQPTNTFASVNKPQRHHKTIASQTVAANTNEKSNTSSANQNSNSTQAEQPANGSVYNEQKGTETSANNQPSMANANPPAESSVSNNPTPNTNPAPATNTQKSSDSGNSNPAQTPVTNSPTGVAANNYVKSEVKHWNTLSIDAGGGYSLGWKNYWYNEGSGLSPVFGVSCTHFFSTKIGLSAGVQYNSLINLKTGYVSTATTYDFGYNNTITSIIPKTLHYIAIPVILRYNFNDDNAICVGPSIQYLFNTTSTVTTSSQSTMGSATSQSKSQYGYTQGFNNIDLQARVAYRRRIYKAFSATVEGYFGLLDVENSFFSDNSFKRNEGIRFVLSYDLIK